MNAIETLMQDDDSYEPAHDTSCRACTPANHFSGYGKQP